MAPFQGHAYRSESSSTHEEIRLGTKLCRERGAQLPRVSGRREYGFSFVDFNFYFYSQKRSYRDGSFPNRSSWITDRLLDADYAANVGSGHPPVRPKRTPRCHSSC
jgi:hypothetical protein